MDHTWMCLGVCVCVCVFYMGLDVRKIAVGVECVCTHSLSTGHEQDGQAAEDREDHGDDDQDGLGLPGAVALVPPGAQNQSRDLAALAVVSLPAPGEWKRVRPEECGGGGGGGGRSKEGWGGGVGAWGQTLTCTRAPAGLRSTCSRRERSSARGWRCRDPAWSSGWMCTHW